MPRFDLVAVDLDGTLFDSSRRVPDANRRALRRLNEAGVKIAVVTGRRLPAALPGLKGLDLDPLLVLNGGALVKEGFEGPMLHRSLLPLNLARKVVVLGREMGAEPVVHDGPNGEGHILIESVSADNRSLARYLEKTTPPPRLVPDLIEALEHDPVQIMFAAGVEEIRKLTILLASRLKERPNLARTEYQEEDFALLDVLDPSASKAGALRFLARRYGIPHQKTMAIGDNWNDVEMLEAAGFAVLMANAPPELHGRGFTMTGTNDEAGVAQAIDRYALSRDG